MYGVEQCAGFDLDCVFCMHMASLFMCMGFGAVDQKGVGLHGMK